MENSHITILGSNSAVSVNNRFPSGQVFSFGKNHILIDCGEGSQFRMDQYNVRKAKIDTILITHLHGDHVFGLPGLLTSFQLAGRTRKLTIFGPQPIKKYIDLNLGGIGHFISYPLEIVELENEDFEVDKLHLIFENNSIKIEAFHLYHRITCFGYKISEKPRRANISKEFIEQYAPNVDVIKSIINGADFTQSNGQIVANEDIMLQPVPIKSYAYCSDTMYHSPLANTLHGTTCIYHESTYLEHLSKQAAERGHSTAKEAGLIANGASAQKLILGHYSSRYIDTQPFKEEASATYSGEIILAKEGLVVEI